MSLGYSHPGNCEHSIKDIRRVQRHPSCDYTVDGFRRYAHARVYIYIYTCFGVYASSVQLCMLSAALHAQARACFQKSIEKSHMPF